jgi:histidinol phosphatase-like PHP family hydrolase
VKKPTTIIEDGRSLTELPVVGPTISRIIRKWIEDPPSVPKPPAIRAEFLTATSARSISIKKAGWTKSLNGDLQMHTAWSDGSGSVEDMARAAVERGYEFIAITDHSKGLKIAGGINEEQLEGQGDDIEAVNTRLHAEGIQFQVLRSIEVNLTPAGKTDMDSGALTRVDVVLGCFHSALRKNEDQTERYVSALRNPDIQILGHPRGRIYNYCIGLKANWERVFAVATDLDKTVEIDGYPDRQDLSHDLLKLAKSSGCRISLGTDSHDPQQLRFMDYSLAAAVRADIAKDRILNFMSVNELKKWVASLRAKTRRFHF